MSKKTLNIWSKALAALFIFGLLTGCSSQTKHSALIKEAMTEMKSITTTLGAPSVLADSLFFGTTKINDNFVIVDSLKAKYGCTATLFLKKGDKFIRISTDVVENNQRAVGTELDPNGVVIVAILKGEPFYGIVDILGNKYDAGYEPIVNATGEVIGVYYVGFEL